MIAINIRSEFCKSALACIILTLSLVSAGCVVKTAAKVPVKATKTATGLILPYRQSSDLTSGNEQISKAPSKEEMASKR